MFDELNYESWCLSNNLADFFGVELSAYGAVGDKRIHGLYTSVDPNNHNPFVPELDDLTRLHYLVRTRKVTTILEFGVGKSTLVFADALRKNKADYGEFVTANLRRANPFEVHAVDNCSDFIKVCEQEFPGALCEYVNFHFSAVEMTTFNDRACTMYETLPNICPDFIYLDGPDQFNAKGTVRGISTASADRLPMSADILMMEPFLLPGTLIVVDGRTANARFLKNNLQRDWTYQHYFDEDIHIFELVEPPFGLINKRQMDFCLGA